jgi:predicted AAA+ superfamily ATPase
MFPLTFSEFLHFKQVDRVIIEGFASKEAAKNPLRYELMYPHFQEYLEFGGFPSVVLETNPERKRQLLAEIFTSYFEKDAKNLADFADMSKLRDLILLLIARIGSRIEINKLASDLSISRQTVYNYLAFLEQTYFISLLPRHSGSIDRQAAGSRKLFLCDAGMASYLGRVSQGQLLEQGVFQTLRVNHELSFHNVSGNDEIDFVVDKQVALEVKMSASRRDLAKLKTRANTIDLDNLYVITDSFINDAGMIPACDL